MQKKIPAAPFSGILVQRKEGKSIKIRVHKAEKELKKRIHVRIIQKTSLKYTYRRIEYELYETAVVQ